MHIDSEYEAAGPAQETTLPFEVEHAGRRYQCRRTVRGTVRQTQRIEVVAVGECYDTGAYGADKPPVDIMQDMARIIALQLIMADRPGR